MQRSDSRAKIGIGSGPAAFLTGCSGAMNLEMRRSWLSYGINVVYFDEDPERASRDGIDGRLLKPMVPQYPQDQLSVLNCLVLPKFGVQNQNLNLNIFHDSTILERTCHPCSSDSRTKLPSRHDRTPEQCGSGRHWPSGPEHKRLTRVSTLHTTPSRTFVDKR